MIPNMNGRRVWTRCFSSVLWLLGTGGYGPIAAVATNSAEIEALQRAEAALQAARSCMWGRAIDMGGDVRIRSGSDTERRLRFDLQLEPGPVCPRTVFTLRSAVGTALERMTVDWCRPPRWLHFEGPDLLRGEPASGDTSVAGTTLVWSELTLPFLWWTNLHFVGSQVVKGRMCDVIDLVAPPDERRWSRVRLYVDRELGVFLRADTFDRRGERDAVIEAKALRRVEKKYWIVSRLDINRRDERIIVRVREARVQQ